MLWLSWLWDISKIILVDLDAAANADDTFPIHLGNTTVARMPLCDVKMLSQYRQLLVFRKINVTDIRKTVNLIMLSMRGLLEIGFT